MFAASDGFQRGEIASYLKEGKPNACEFRLFAHCLGSPRCQFCICLIETIWATVEALRESNARNADHIYPDLGGSWNSFLY